MFTSYNANMKLWFTRISKKNTELHLLRNSSESQECLEKAEPENTKTRRFYHLRQCLEASLAGKLPPKEALPFIKEINSYSNEADLKAAGQRIALLVDDSIGKDILKLLDKDKFLEITF